MSAAEIVTVIGALTAAIVSIISAYASLRNGGKLDQVHTLVNGQSTRMESLAQQTGFAQGSMGQMGKPPTGVRGIAPHTHPQSGESI